MAEFMVRRTRCLYSVAGFRVDRGIDGRVALMVNIAV
jgi:hypothetical protein